MGEVRRMGRRVLDLTFFAPIGLAATLRDRRRAAGGGAAPGRPPVDVSEQLAPALAVGVGDAVDAPIAQLITPPQLASQMTAAALAAAPFEGYLTMPAVHIVERMSTMDRDALAALRAYETSHRARRTIVAMADQLLGG